MPVDQVQSDADLAKQYGGVVETPQYNLTISDADLAKQYGGVAETPQTGSQDVLEAVSQKFGGGKAFADQTPEAQQDLRRIGNVMVSQGKTASDIAGMSAPLPAGTPGFQVAPGTPATPPAEEPTTALGEVKNFGKQIGSQLFQGYGNVAHLSANIYGLLDAAADKISQLTGTEKGGFFKSVEDYARAQQEAAQQEATRLAGGRQDIPSKMTRAVSGMVFNLPTAYAATAAAAELPGLIPAAPAVGGMAMLGALQTADQGWKNQLQAAFEGALQGGLMHVISPGGRIIRFTVPMLTTYKTLVDQGVDPETAATNALVMGGVSAVPSGGIGLGQMLEPVTNRLPPIPPLFPNRNPTERAAMQYLVGEGVHVPVPAASGSRFLGGLQRATEATPFGAMIGEAGRERSVQGVRELAGRLHAAATPETPPNELYQEFYDAENDPRSSRRVPTGDLGARGEPIFTDMQMPVPVGVLKPALEPIYDQMQWMPMADRNASAGYRAIERILKGPDYIPASQAETGLSGIKNMIRTGEGRNQGLAKFIAPKLQGLIDRAVGDIGGDEAVGSLQRGRIAAAQQAGADWLKETFDRALAEGGFNRQDALWNKWLNLPEEAKRTMYSPKQVSDLNNFFLGVKNLFKNVNPSGTAQVLAVFHLLEAMQHPIAVGSEVIGGAAIAKLLNSKFGLRLLTEGLRTPENTLRGKEIQRQLGNIIGPPEEPPEGPPTGGGGTPPINPNQPAAPGEAPPGGLWDTIKEAARKFWESEEGTQRIPQRTGPEDDYSTHLPPPEGERVSPLKPLQPPERSLDYLRRSAERDPSIGSPDNQRTEFRDKDGTFVVGKITPRDWVQRVKSNLSADEMVNARKWYRELEDFFVQHFGEEAAPKMALAWLSSQQNVSPSGGMTNVLRAADQIRGMPKEKVAGLAEAKILAALRGEVPEGGYGAKLNDFVDSALGKRTRTWMGDDPRGGQPAVIDVWANRDVGKIDQKMLDYLTKRFGADAVNKLKVDGKAITETDYDYGSKFYNNLVDYLNRTNFDGGGWTGDQVQAVGWTAMQKALGATPEFASDLISKNTRRYAFEVQPGEGAPVLQQYPWHTLSTEQQAKVSDYLGTRITDLAAKLTGAKITNRNVTRGAYLGQPTISVQMDVFGSPETFRDFGRAAGYLGQQSEVWNVRPLKTGNSTALFIRGNKLNTPELQQEFWQKLSDRVGANLVPGYSPMGGETGNGVFIVNPFSKQYLFERAKAGFKTDTSLRPWTAQDKARINAGIEAVADEMGLDLDVEDGKVDIGASLHNWARKGGKNGHLQRLIETGRSTISDKLLDYAPETLQSWWKEAWDQFGPGSPQGGAPSGAEIPSQKVTPTLDQFRAGGEKEPPVAPGMTRLYRGEKIGSKPSSGTARNWWSSNREEAEFHALDQDSAGRGTHHVAYIDVPKADADKYDAFNHPEAVKQIGPGESPYIVPANVAAGKKTLFTSKHK